MAVLEVSINYKNPSYERFCKDYWGSELERMGFFHLAWNDGACRLLVPKTQEHHVKDMLTAKSTIITRGFSSVLLRDSMEILFDDGTQTPFVVTLDHDQCTQLLPDSEIGIEFQLSVWTQKGLVVPFKCKYNREISHPTSHPVAMEVTRFRQD